MRLKTAAQEARKKKPSIKQTERTMQQKKVSQDRKQYHDETEIKRISIETPTDYRTRFNANL
jgi:hypothetical protein